MKILFLIYFITTCVWAEVTLPRAATGIEAGITRLTSDGKSLSGPSWVYHFEYQVDPYVIFFGQAGSAHAEDSSNKFQQTIFAGGLEFDVIPYLGLRVGLAENIIKVKTSSSNDRYQEAGPMAALNFSVVSGIFKYGSSLSFVRSSHMNSASLRALLFLEF